jgi:predicted transcriptional regulator
MDEMHFTNRTDKDLINDVFKDLILGYPNFQTLNEIAGSKDFSYDTKKDIENLIIGTGLVDSKDEGLYKGFKLTNEGWNLMRKHREYLNYIANEKWSVLIEKDKQRGINDEKTKLEIEQLTLNIDKLVNEVSDYEETKSRSKRSELYALFAVILTGIGLIIQWKCNNHG